MTPLKQVNHGLILVGRAGNHIVLCI